MRRSFIAVAGVAGALSLAISSTSAAAPDTGRDSGGQQALDLGLQVAAKDVGKAALSARLNPNPYLANLPTLQDANYFAWNKQMKQASLARAKSSSLAANKRQAAVGQLPPAFVYDEQEPAGSAGSNDTHANAEPITGFGTAAAKNPRVRILGSLAPPPSSALRTITTTEDQGSIPLATDTGIRGSGRARVSSTLGDGPHGPSGDGSNDFDFYRVDVAAGETLTADTEGSAAGTDTILVVYAADGTPVAADDDSGTGVLSALSYTPDQAGSYYVMVGGYAFDPLPEDPFDSGSGLGGADTGAYTATMGSQRQDTDFFSVRLRPGDTVGAVGNGVATGLKVRTPSGEERVGGVETDASSLYPPSSPLPGGGNTTIAYVAEQAGWYSIQVTGTSGSYQATVEGYRPGTKGDPGRRQTVLLDFNPGRVNTGTWGGPGVRDVSPFGSFLPAWGIGRARQNAMEARVTRLVQDNIKNEVQRYGLNPAVNVEVLNARLHPELIGRENVSRIYVAGTIAQTGISTIGIAQYIDPGNFGHQDEAIVLLDVLSAPAGPVSSLNTFMNASSDREVFVGRAVANVTAHEIGHTIGNYHTDNADEIHNMMDSGGANFADNLYGVGPDGVGGTADDENIMFRKDVYSPVEGFTGWEHTLNVTAWAYAGR